MFINNFDPVAFNISYIEIRWYSLAYIFGIILGWIYIKINYLKQKNSKILFDNFISYLILGIIIGGRLGYVLIYNFNYYVNNLFEILFIWKGGMSFHGGVIGVIFSTYIFSRNNKIDIFEYLDLVSLGAPIGIFFGRVSNYINSELYGKATDILWSVKFLKVDNLNRHPSQIYEAIFEGVILFIILNYFYRSKIKQPGVISSLFLIYYSFFRFFIEFTREPDSHIGYVFMNFSIGQIICLLTFVVGTILFKIRTA
ncbi:MAG: prolipoprotein diacylglyceryl transferase [Candidatus Pelagibacter sp. TMED118]|nr:MAG: prolipoprotein diacylglyceryl transferase [Candidatus Pelagibacter sp. TMED118]|tara:strand:- start:631 stop:1395 length:765 start_codon:yes stop_codon:yes gene_type:complete